MYYITNIHALSTRLTCSKYFKIVAITIFIIFIKVAPLDQNNHPFI